MEGSGRVTAWETKTICPTCKTFAWACQHRGQPEAGEWMVCPACGRMGERDTNLVRAARLFVTGSAAASSGEVIEQRARPYSVIDEWMGEREQAQPTPADGDDYTYDLRTPTERAAFRLDDLERRTGIAESQIQGLVRAAQTAGRFYEEVVNFEGAAIQLETELRTEIRTLAERIQHIEHILEQWTGHG